MRSRHAMTTVFSIACAVASAWMAEAAADTWATYVPAFNRTDEELYKNAIPNSAAEEFLRANAPSFECPDKEIERTYHFRWWTYRKHLRKAAGGWIVSEFLPPVGWAGPEGTINCASGHHVREGRWLSGGNFVYDYLRFLLERGRTRERGAYAWWPATSLGDWLDVTGETEKALSLLPLLKENFAAWERGWSYGGWFWIGKDGERNLFAITDGYEGTEMSLTGVGYRPLVNAAMYGEAKALERFCRLVKDVSGADFYRGCAAALELAVKRQLWDSEKRFFLTMRLDGVRTPVRELHGYAPWYFGLPLDRSYDCAFGWLTREDGFFAPKGLAFPERSAKGFVLAYEGHACQWNGPSWPLATSVALTALGRHLQSGGKGDSSGAFHRLLHQYAEQHRRTREDGTVVPWIDENVNPLTGDWMSRTIILRTPWMREWFFRERGKDYNHSTFCDLVISGLVGFIPHSDGTYDLRPLAPKGWESFSLHNLRHCGRILDIDYSRTRGLVVTERLGERQRRLD